jgi:hypothetical protein
LTCTNLNLGKAGADYAADLTEEHVDQQGDVATRRWG